MASLLVWIQITIWVLTAIGLGFGGWYTTYQGLRQPSVSGDEILVENSLTTKIIAVALAVTVLLGAAVMVQLVLGYTREPYSLMLAFGAWLVLFGVMIYSMLHFSRAQLFVSREGIYIRGAFKNRFLTYSEIAQIYEIEGEPWFVIQPKRGMELHVSKEMKGWQQARELIDRYANDQGSPVHSSVDRGPMWLVRLITGLLS